MMTDYSITGLSSMGTVSREEHTKDAGLFNMPMPGSDSPAQILIDIFGTTRTITIGGTFTDTVENIKTFIIALDALANGSQTQKTFVSGKSGVSYNGLVTSVNWISEEGAPTKVDYIINFTEGSA